MENNALKMQGAGDIMVQKKITKQPFIKGIAKFWVLQTRAMMLHKTNNKGEDDSEDQADFVNLSELESEFV